METIIKNPGKSILVVLLITLAILGIRVIETGTVGIKSTTGKYDTVELNPGLNLIIPLVQSVIVVDTKIQKILYKGVNDLEDVNGIMNKPFIDVLDIRGLTVNIEMAVQYHLLGSEAAEMLTVWGANWQEKEINSKVREAVRDVIGNYKAENLPSNRAKIAGEINLAVKTSVEKKTENRVIVDAVLLRNILLPEKIKAKIEQVQIAKQQVEVVNQQIAAASKEQEKKKIEAETAKIQKVVAAEADAEKRVIRANATATKIKLEADAQAYANDKVSKSINPEILSWKKLEVAQIQAEALKVNPNTTIFVGTPAKNTTLDMWLPAKKSNVE